MPTCFSRPIIWLSAAGMLLHGCGSLIGQPAAEITYYQLDYPAPRPASSAPVAQTIMIWPIRIAAEYDRDALVYRDEHHRAGLYAYDQWIASPAKQMTEKLVRDFEAARIFQAVCIAGTFQKPDYALYGNIRELGERRENDARFGAATVSFTLTHVRTEAATPSVVFQREYVRRVQCADASRPALVAALCTAVQQAVSNLVGDVRAAVQTP